MSKLKNVIHPEIGGPFVLAMAEYLMKKLEEDVDDGWQIYEQAALANQHTASLGRAGSSRAAAYLHLRVLHLWCLALLVLGAEDEEQVLLQLDGFAEHLQC